MNSPSIRDLGYRLEAPMGWRLTNSSQHTYTSYNPHKHSPGDEGQEWLREGMRNGETNFETDTHFDAYEI